MPSSSQCLQRGRVHAHKSDPNAPNALAGVVVVDVGAEQLLQRNSHDAGGQEPPSDQSRKAKEARYKASAAARRSEGYTEGTEDKVARKEGRKEGS